MDITTPSYTERGKALQFLFSKEAVTFAKPSNFTKVDFSKIAPQPLTKDYQQLLDVSIKLACQQGIGETNYAVTRQMMDTKIDKATEQASLDSQLLTNKEGVESDGQISWGHNIALEAKPETVQPAPAKPTSNNMQATTEYGTKIKIQSFALDTTGEILDEDTTTKLLTVERADGLQMQMYIDQNMRINEREDGSISFLFTDSGTIKSFDKDGNLVTGAVDSSEAGSDGNDIIINYNNYNVEGNGGNDTIINFAHGATINTGDGNNTVYLADTQLGAQIIGGDGSSYIHGGYVYGTSIGGSGNITFDSTVLLNSRIHGTGSTVTVNSGEMLGSTIIGGTGSVDVNSDSLWTGNITGGTGNITINAGLVSRGTVTGGAGSIEVNSKQNIANLTFKGGDGYTAINAGGDITNSTFQGGKGDTSIISKQDINQSQFNGDSGTISIGAGGRINKSDLIGNSGTLNLDAGNGIYESDIKGGTGTTNVNSGHSINKSSITGDYGSINVYAESAIRDSTIKTGSADDSVYAGFKIENSQINTGAGNDVIYTEYIENATLDGGEGNDFIIAKRAGSAAILSGSGDDILWVGGSTATRVNGGDGNDVIYSNIKDHAAKAEQWIDTTDPQINAQIARLTSMSKAAESTAKAGGKPKVSYALNDVNSQQASDEYAKMYERLQSPDTAYHKSLQANLLARLGRNSYSALATKIALDGQNLY